MLIAMTAMAQTTGYEVNFTGTKSSDRPLNFVKVQSTSYGTSNYNLTEAEKLQLYVDATESVTFKVGAGDVVTPTAGYGAVWMHAYVYVDADGDGTFTAGVAEDGYTPTGDLVSYSAYNADPDGAGQWRNSAGESNGNNTVALPTFKAPETVGKYRMRFKIDWNSIDPAGNLGNEDGTNTLKANRGSIVDVTLEVAEAQEGYVEELFKTTKVTDGVFADGTTWYTIQIGANGYVIDNNGSANNIALDEVISDATAAAQLWAFTGDNTNGFKLYNKEAGATKVLAAPTRMTGTTGSTSYPVLVDAENVPEGYTDTWLFTESSDLGEGSYYYMYEKGYPNNKVNNRDNILAFWNGGADAGSTLNIQFAQAEYPITTLTGEWTASNAAGTWASGWQSTATPHISLNETQARNNMAAYNGDGDLQLYTCLANAAVNGVYTASYTIAAEDGYSIAGYRFDFVSSGSHNVTVTPTDGEAVTADSSTAQSVVVEGKEEAVLSFTITSSSNMFANTKNFYATIVRVAPEVEEYQEIFTTKKGGIPYRIPAIAMAKNGALIAVADYRHSGSDIGVVNYGRIDLHARISKDNGENWGDLFPIVEGQGSKSPDFMHVGFGDPAIVADRESNRVLVLSCAGNVSFQNGTRNKHQNIARFYSEDNGVTWSEPVDIAEEIYSKWDNSSHGPVMAMFVGSGKIHQSRYVKVNDYYRLYCSVLLKNKNATYTNFVLYSDDFGGTWEVLGGVNTAPIPNGADEPKVEELPNGNVIVSSRCTGGRHFNIFTFTDAEKAKGTWGTRATSDASVNGIVAVNNSTNGEILIIPAVRNEDGENVWVALQSVPFGSGRTNVGIYYKELASEMDYNTPANFAKDWDGRHQSTMLPSAYSTMCLQGDSTIAFLYEESTHGADYTIIYKKYSLEDITDGAYSMSGDVTLPEPDNTPSDETIALIATVKEVLAYKGLGYPSETARESILAALAKAEENPTEAAGVALSTALEAYYTTTDIVRPENGKKYTFTAVYGDKRFYIYNNNGTLAVAARAEGQDLPAEAVFTCEYDAEADYKFQFKTSDGAYYLAYPTIGGKSWLDGESLTGLETTSSKVTKFNVSKILAGGSVASTNEALFGLVQMDGCRGYDNGKNTDSYGPIVVKHSALTFDGAGDPYYNENFTSAFIIEEAGFGVKSVTPSPDATVEENIKEFVITFTKEITLDETKNVFLTAFDEEYASSSTVGTFVEVSATDPKALVITPHDPVGDGKYILVVEAGAVVTADGETNEELIYEFNVAINYETFIPTRTIPTDGETVESLSKIIIEYDGYANDYPAYIVDVNVIYVKDMEGNTVTTGKLAWGTSSYTSVDINLSEEIKTNGTYQVIVPSYSIYNKGWTNAATRRCNPELILTFTVENNDTAIEGVDSEQGIKTIYDLSGRKVENPAKGIYIINGKKVTVK